MSVSTIFLQTSNEGSNEYGDTTFSIHVPAQDKSYKLSCASFMFRPKIILMGTEEYMRFRIKVTRYTPKDYNTSWTSFRFQDIDLTIPVYQDIQFLPSKIDTTAVTDLFPKQHVLNLPVHLKKYQYVQGEQDTIFRYKLVDMQWIITSDNRLKLEWTKRKLTPDDYLGGGEGKYHERDDPKQMELPIIHCELVEVTPKLAHFTGLSPAVFERTYFPGEGHAEYDFKLTGPRFYNPQYWNYITLSCNKSYNTGNVVNQERYNHDIDDSSQFYKGQILAYMPNNAYAPEAMQTGMATANEYIIQPADFNSIRFWLNYDNGEPVKLCSPMTIVLNMMPNQ